MCRGWISEFHQKQQGGPLIPKDDPKGRRQPSLGLVIDKIICSDLALTIETNSPDKPPLVFAIHHVTLRDVGLKKPLLFDAALVNPKPVGQIHSTGRLHMRTCGRSRASREAVGYGQIQRHAG